MTCQSTLIAAGRLLFLLAAGLSWSAAALYGQARDSASIFGTVEDSTGGVAPGVVVTLTNVDTGSERTAETGATGSYSFTSVPVGNYMLSAELAGFRRYERINITLQANENVKADVTLEVGQVTEVVTVSAGETYVETRSATVKQTVDSRRVVDLPLNGRNAADLTLLAPGVTPAGGVSGDRGFGLGVTVPQGGKNLSINGSRQNNILYTLDGGSHTDSYSKVNLPFPFPDAVQEFSVQTSNMEAEVGVSSAGVVNVVTKSGTNEFHGNAFWFVRNTVLNATDFFSHEEDQLKRNQAGFTVGGPVKKDRIFFFGGFQKLTIRTASGSSRANTLTQDERNGNFGDRTIMDPVTGTPFANNIIPGERQSPAAQNLLDWSPLPDADGFARFVYSSPEDAEQYVARADYTISSRQFLRGRVFRDNQLRSPVSLGSNLHAFRRGFENRSSAALIGHSFVSANIVVDTRISANHIYNSGRSSFDGTIAQFGVALTPLSNDISIAIDGASGMGVPMQIQFNRADEEFSHDWAWNMDTHTLKWGVSMNWKQYNEETRFRSSGFFNFNGSRTGVGRADFILGDFAYFTQNNGELENRRQKLPGFYFNDSWRMTRRFTLNLGMRFEPYWFFTDTKDRNHVFHLPNYEAGVQTGQYNNAPPGLVYRGDPRPWGGGGNVGPSVTDPDIMNFAPRAGIAWDPTGDGKTSVRAGYAIFYSTPSLRSQNDANNVAPFSYSVELNEGRLDDPYAGNQHLNLFPVDKQGPDAPFADPLATIVLDNKWVLASVQNWSLTVERELLPSTLLRVAYVGTKGTNLTGLWDQNAPVYDHNRTYAENTSTINARRPIAGYQAIARWMHGFNSVYHGLQLTLDRRFTKGLTYSASYTWSKGVDYYSQDESASFGRARRTNPFDFFEKRGLNDFHRKHRFVGSFVWDLPDPTGSAALKAVLGGWQASGIVTMQSGGPFEIWGRGNPTAGAGNARVDLLGTGYPGLSGSRSKGEKIARFFDVTRFANTRPGTYGTLGRNAMIGPGFGNVDIAVMKGGPVKAMGEQGRWEYRFEAFNLFNATHLGNPNSTITNTARFGTITGIADEPRILQMSLKFFF